MDASDRVLDIKASFRDLKVSATRERCQALRLALSRFTAKIQTSPATQHVISAIQIALTASEAHLESYATNPDLDLLEETELENSLQFVGKIVPLIYNIIGLTENADVASVPPEIISPIRREVHKLFPRAEIIVVSDSSLNYSILDISGYIRYIVQYLGSSLSSDFPEQIFRASIPSVEFDQALLHCILSHELGHPLYGLHGIQSKIFPIQISEERVKKIYQTLRRSNESESTEDKPQQYKFPFDEILFRSVVTARVEERISRWVQELSADLFGMAIFGPAYLYAFIYFSSSFQLLDSGSDSHPPARLRLSALFSFLKQMYSQTEFSERTAHFLDVWRNISERETDYPVLLDRFAIGAIRENRVIEKLQTIVLESLGKEAIYTENYYTEDLKTLLPLINAQIPPAEIRMGHNTYPSRIVGILNAGWEAYLGGLDRFKANLGQPIDDFKLRLRFNRFLMKSMELNEIILDWGDSK